MIRRARCWVARDGSFRALILSPSLVKVGGWRVTHWDALGPLSHEEYPSKDAALHKLRRPPGIAAVEAVPEWGIEAEPASYVEVQSEPSWLGHTVISGGVVAPVAPRALLTGEVAP